MRGRAASAGARGAERSRPGPDPREMPRREFLGWDRPALAAVAERLVEEASETSSEGLASLDAWLVVTPTARAGRRLVELLLEAAQRRGRALLPPETATPGALGARLLIPERRMASPTERAVAWRAAVSSAPAETLAALGGETAVAPPLGPGELASLASALHEEIARAGCGFADARAHVPPEETRRWSALEQLEHAYRAALDRARRIDPALAEGGAETTTIDRPVALVGVVELPPVLRALLARLGDRVTAWIHAPEAHAAGFDELGCLVAAYWQRHDPAIPAERVTVVGDPADQADAVADAIAATGGAYRPEQITLGAADPELAAPLLHRLRAQGLTVRAATGPALEGSAPAVLLRAAADYLEEGRFEELAALLRQPDLARALPGPGSRDPAEALDAWHAERLPTAARPEAAPPDLAPALEALESWLAPLRGPEAPRGAWAGPVLELLERVYGERTLETGRDEGDRALAEALAAIRDAAAEAAAVPEALADAERVSGAEAIRLILEPLAGGRLPPSPEEEALELLGWLELPLDDAPVLVAAGIQEGVVPQTAPGPGAAGLLPEPVRRGLGLADNASRLARDAYSLSAACAGRRRVAIVAGRRNADGDPLLPSRLLLGRDPATVAERVEGNLAPRARGSDRLLARAPTRADGAFARWPPPPPETGPIERLPVTAFAAYIACPYRFYLRHVLGLEPLADDRRELDAAQIGSLVHDLLGAFGRSEVADSADPEAIEAWLSAGLDARFRAFGRDRPPAVGVQREQLRWRLRSFAAWQAARREAGWRIEHVELPVDAAPLVVDGEAVTAAGRPFAVRGRIDRVDVHEATGQRLILDYKTAERDLGPRDTHHRGREPDAPKDWTDLQLPLYRHLAAHAGLDRVEDLGYIVLPAGEIPDGRHDRLAGWDASALAAADARAAEVVAAIAAGIFYPPADAVAFDDFAELCGSAQFTAMAEVPSEPEEEA